MLIEVFEHSLMITSFVFVMMLVIEYLNVLTRGRWEQKVRSHRWEQCLLAVLLGATPGCLGAFAVVSLYSHRVITVGALVAAMIATCGDETFVMLAMFPGKSMIVIGMLAVIGFAVGVAIDAVMGARRTGGGKEALERYVPVHSDEDRCVCFSRRELIDQWKRCRPHRGILACFLFLYLLGVAFGEIGHSDHWDWVRVTLLVTGTAGLLIVCTVPDHFLEEHLWEHIARVHIWKIFLWTLVALFAIHMVVEHLQMEAWIKGSPLTVLFIACLVGLIPQSGPHLIFVTLYAEGSIPFSIFLASCIVQDGHGMLPLLAHSRRAFVSVKAVNFAVGLAVGLIGYFMGW